MSEAKLLRALADKIEELDAVKLFPAEVTDPGTLTVSWSEGSDHDGYKGLSEAISALVKQHWGALRSQVVKQSETEVQAARDSWKDHDQKKDARAPTPTVALETAPRVVAEPALRRAS